MTTTTFQPGQNDDYVGCTARELIDQQPRVDVIIADFTGASRGISLTSTAALALAQTLATAAEAIKLAEVNYGSLAFPD